MIASSFLKKYYHRCKAERIDFQSLTHPQAKFRFPSSSSSSYDILILQTKPIMLCKIHTYIVQSTYKCITHHCNDDLNIINEQRIPMVNSSNLVLWQCKIAIFKIRSPALLEGRLYTGRKIRQIGQNGLCMPTSISKRAGDMISKMAILHCQSTKLLKLTIGLPCSFIILRSSLQ